jgi:predicted  nucleic acid-binding Zn-ribbon protein
MVRIADLYALQEIDSRIDASQKQLDELRNREDEGEELRTARERLVELEARKAELDVEQRQASYDVEDIRTQVGGVESKLYSGSITSSKELRDLQRELEILQRRQREREEVLLGVMTGLEETNAGIAVTRSILAEGEAARERELAEAEVSAAAIERDLEELRGRRDGALRPIEQSALALYERLRRTRQGRAVARVERGACLGCRLVLPSNLFQRARSGATIVQCSSCERILYVG